MIVVTFALGGCSDSRGRFYAFTPRHVQDVIDVAELPSNVFGDQAVVAKHWRANSDTTMWTLQSTDGNEVLRLSATIASESSGTRVRVDALPPVGVNHDQIAKVLAARGRYYKLYTSALAEQIEADLTNRDFKLTNVSSMVDFLTLEALPTIRLKMDEAGNEFRKRDQEVIDGAYAREDR